MRRQFPKKLTRAQRRRLESDRNVVTRYYWDYEAQWTVRNIRSKYPGRAAMRAHGNLHTLTYGAVLAEVFDEVLGKLYAVIRMELNGQITVIYQSEADQIDLIHGV